MATTPITARTTPHRRFVPTPKPRQPSPRRIAWNFAMMSGAEIACRGTSVAVTLSLTKRLGIAGYGRVEFAFNVVFWLVLLVRDGFEVIAARELARHPRLIRPLANHILAVKGLLALALYAVLLLGAFATLSDPYDRLLFALYGLMLLTTALGIDYIYRGLEDMGILAVSLIVRTAIYAVGVWFWVGDASRIIWVPAWLTLGEVLGIGLVWIYHARNYGWPRPIAGGRFLRVFLLRGRSVLLIHFAQTVLASIDLMVVGLICGWGQIETGLFAAPHRMVAAVLTFGLIFQQVVFPTLARSWRGTPEEGRKSLDALMRILAVGMLPIAVGTTVLAEPIVKWIFPVEYGSSASLLAIGIWRAPLLTLAFLYQTALIALNREAVGVRILLMGALISGPLAALLLAGFGLPGAAASVPLTAIFLGIAGYMCLSNEGRQPAWHHQLAKPTLACLAMVIVCKYVENQHVVVAVVMGAVAYAVVLFLVGGLKRSDLRAVIGKG